MNFHVPRCFDWLWDASISAMIVNEPSGPPMIWLVVLIPEALLHSRSCLIFIIIPEALLHYRSCLMFVLIPKALLCSQWCLIFVLIPEDLLYSQSCLLFVLILKALILTSYVNVESSYCTSDIWKYSYCLYIFSRVLLVFWFRNNLYVYDPLSVRMSSSFDHILWINPQVWCPNITTAFYHFCKIRPDKYFLSFIFYWIFKYVRPDIFSKHVRPDIILGYKRLVSPHSLLIPLSKTIFGDLFINFQPPSLKILFLRIPSLDRVPKDLYFSFVSTLERASGRQKVFALKNGDLIPTLLALRDHVYSHIE